MIAEDVRLVVYPMPGNVKAFVKKNRENICIVINDNLSDEAKITALHHELQHIGNDDLNSSLSAEVIESRIMIR